MWNALGPGWHNVACSFLFKLSTGLAQGVWSSGNASIWIKNLEGGTDERVRIQADHPNPVHGLFWSTISLTPFCSSYPDIVIVMLPSL